MQLGRLKIYRCTLYTVHTLRLVHCMQSKDKEYDQSSANSRCRKEFCDEASKKRQCRDKVPERRHNQWGVLDIGFLKMLQSFSFVVWSDLTWEPICNNTLSLVNCPTRWPLHCQMKYSSAMYYAELEFDSIFGFSLAQLNLLSVGHPLF